MLTCIFSFQFMAAPVQAQTDRQKKIEKKKARRAAKAKKKREDGKESDSRPLILADETRFSDSGMVYLGHVEVRWKTYRIYADQVEYQPDKRTLTADGRVTITSDESVISGSRLTFQLKDQTGVIEEAVGMMPPSVAYSSDRLNMTGAETIRFDRLTFTSCNQRVPRWEIKCRKGKIVKERYIEMKSATIRIKKVPILYLPYMRYPIDPDGKSTGFLFPGIGSSSQRGFFIQNAFFWNIRSNLDLTLNADYYSKAGWGLGQEFRYMFPSMNGRIRFYWLTYKEGNEINPDSKSDYYLEANNQIDINFLESRLVVKANYPSDPNFLRLFNNNFDTVLMTRFGSAAQWSSKYRNITFSAQASRNETYYTFNNSSRVVETLPGVDLNLNQQQLGPIPGYLSMRLSLERVRRSGITYVGEPEYASDITSQRINVVPSYTLNLLKTPWLNTSVNLESRNNFYAKSIDPESNEIVDEPLHLYYNQAQIKLEGPRFFRIFGTKHFRLKHVIEPEMVVRYVDQIDPEDLERLLKVDRYDFPPYSYVSFSLSHALLLKKRNSDDSAREVLRHTVTQRYFIDSAEANYFLKIDGEYPEFSELENSLRIRPLQGLSLDVRASYNYYIKDFRNFDVSMSYKDPQERIHGAVTFSYYKNPYQISNYVFNRTLVRGNLGFNFPGFPLKMRSAVDYDFTEKKFRLGSVMLFYDYQCIRFQGEFKVFLRNGENDFQFRFGFSLGNLGMVSQLMGNAIPE